MASGPKPYVAWLVLLGVAAAGGVVWWLARPGTPVGSLAVPGELPLELGAGDRLDFTADVEVLFDGPEHNARPRGCVLELQLATSGGGDALARCDLFETSPGVSVAGGSTYGVDETTGLRRLATTGQRLGCRLEVAAAGRATLRAQSNLTTCVPRVLGASVQVYRSAPRGP
jgi:hypothetical protein